MKPMPLLLGTLEELGEHRLLPLVTFARAEHADVVGEALVAGGLPVVEVALRTSAGLPALERLARRGDLLVGAGTVLTARQVDEVVDAGADFVVSPGISRAVVQRCLGRGVLCLAGAVTATELMLALELGLEVVKFFPAQQSGGAATVAALSAPFARLRFVPTGGIGPGELGGYLALPSVLAVGGSWMVPGDRVVAGDAQAIEELVSDAVRRVRADVVTPDGRWWE